MAIANMNKGIKKNHHNDFDIDGDYDLFIKIVEDMNKNAGILMPAMNWGLEIGGHNGGDFFAGKKIAQYNGIQEIYENRYSTMRKMLDPWIGCVGLQKISPDTVNAYAGFIRAVDKLKIFDAYFDDSNNFLKDAENLLNTDLGTIIDLNLINSFSKKDRLSILEVGGGYGRLAEGFFEKFEKGKIKYLLLDSVPASLLYSYKYLTENFPDLKIGFYYHGDELDFDLFDCFIMPSWHYQPNKSEFDVCINIQSMQEMNQEHVDYFLNLFDKSVSPEGIIYLSNEKDYVFKGPWNYPSRWNKVLNIRTPRSWTRNSPTEIYCINPTREAYDLAIDICYETQLNLYDEIVNLKHQLNIASYRVEN